MTDSSRTFRSLTSNSFSSILCVSLLGLTTGACGGAPTVDSGEWQGGKPSTISYDNKTTGPAATALTAAVDANQDDIIVDDNSETATVTDAVDRNAPDTDDEQCAPTLNARTENVTVEVERIETEIVEETVQVELIPTALILMDRSSSMKLEVTKDGPSRWDTVKDILFDGDEPLLEELQHTAALGLTHYSAKRIRSGSTGCLDLTQPVSDITFEVGNFETVKAQQSPIVPGSGTPTGDALTSATASLQAVESEGNRHIVLVTDGLPSLCGELSKPGSAAAMQAVEDAAEAAFELGITVHVIGVGPEVAESKVGGSHLEKVAYAGGGTFRTAQTETAIGEAFADVLAQVEVVVVEKTVTHTVTDVVSEEQRTCSFDLDFGAFDKEAFELAGSLSLDGQVLEFDAADGWGFDQEGKAELRGAACDRHMASEEPLEIASFLACPNNPIPHGQLE